MISVMFRSQVVQSSLSVPSKTKCFHLLHVYVEWKLLSLHLTTSLWVRKCAGVKGQGGEGVCCVPAGFRVASAPWPLTCSLLSGEVVVSLCGHFASSFLTEGLSESWSHKVNDLFSHSAEVGHLLLTPWTLMWRGPRRVCVCVWTWRVQILNWDRTKKDTTLSWRDQVLGFVCIWWIPESRGETLQSKCT